MNILLTNDDGIHAEGLWTLATELSKVASVTIAAPDRERSGVGTSVTLHSPIRARKVSTQLDGVTAWAIQGTPGDSVILAIKHLATQQVDLVISGINEGPNLGGDVYISGTVGGALQGFFYNLPSLAVSLADFHGTHFPTAARVARFLVNRIREAPPKKVILNVNVPNLPLEQLEGLEVTRLAERDATDIIEEGHDGKRHYYWIRRAKSECSPEQGTDVWAINRNKVSVTPLLRSPGDRAGSHLIDLANDFSREFRPLSAHLDKSG